MTWQIIEGDCLDVMPTLKSVDHVITDPPYEGEAHTKGRRSRVGWKEKRLVTAYEVTFEPMTEADREAAGREISDLAKQWILVFCQVEAAMKWRASVCVGDANYKRTAIWVKPDGQPQFTGDRPGCGYESIMVAYGSPGRSRWNGGGRVGVFRHVSEARFPFPKNAHPTQKPLALMLELVELFTDPGDHVLDPFCGSGTTGVACLRLGRHFTGIEKDPKYAALSRERLEAESSNSTLHASRAGQTTLFGKAKS